MFILIANIVVWLIILGLLWWCVGLLPLPAPIQQIIQVLFIIMAILVVLSVFGTINLGLPKLI